MINYYRGCVPDTDFASRIFGLALYQISDFFYSLKQFFVKIHVNILFYIFFICVIRNPICIEFFCSIIRASPILKISLILVDTFLTKLLYSCGGSPKKC